MPTLVCSRLAESPDGGPQRLRDREDAALDGEVATEVNGVDPANGRPVADDPVSIA